MLNHTKVSLYTSLLLEKTIYIPIPLKVMELFFPIAVLLILITWIVYHVKSKSRLIREFVSFSNTNHSILSFIKQNRFIKAETTFTIVTMISPSPFTILSSFHALVLLSIALSSISWLTCFNSFSHAILASL